MSNAKADILSRCPAFTSTEGGTTSPIDQMLLRKEQWLEVGAMQLEDEGVETIQLSAWDSEALSPEAKIRMQEKAMLDGNYREVCKQVVR